ncbi:MAG TPA: F0F1 ATP synthase subunit A [Candidatus Saccharimonadales bacterium]|nr:F0F1 ATP synthase subunit A [Candidatus Saccharimonadales bacterium]
MISLFADSGPVVHVAPLNDFTIGGLHITNSMLYGWIILAIMIAVLVKVARRVSVKPRGGLTQYVEAGVDFVTNLVEGAFDDKKIGRKYVPFFVTLFFVILLCNWSGLVPGVGDALQIHDHPLFRPFTADLNSTVAMGLVTMVTVYVASIREVGGFGKFIKHFFMGSPLNPLYLVIGLIEMITDLTRTLSLALRLFLNVTIGEIVIAVFAFLGGSLFPHSILSPITAVPFTLLELGVGALQAYIFVILGVNYLAIAVNSAHTEHEEHDDLTEDEAPETIEATRASGANATT